MALSQVTLDAIAAAVAAALASVAAPASPKASGHVGPSGRKDGREFPCTAAVPCTRQLRSAARAAIHGVEAGGHVSR